jgi:single-strand DNA-binding protein
MSINRTVLVGRLTKDPELRYTPAGDAVCSFTIAVNRNFKNKQTGEQEADFLNIIVWRKQGENAANYLKKGSMAGIDGRIQTRNFEGQDGKRVYITEILAESVQFLEPRSGNTGGEGQSNTNTGGNGYGSNSGQQQSDNGYQSRTQSNNYTRVDDDPFANNGKTIDISDDDLPF